MSEKREEKELEKREQTRTASRHVVGEGSALTMSDGRISGSGAALKFVDTVDALFGLQEKFCRRLHMKGEDGHVGGQDPAPGRVLLREDGVMNDMTRRQSTMRKATSR